MEIPFLGGISLKKLTVAANSRQLQRAVINPVDQNQVWLDVAIPETMPVAGQSVVDILVFQWLITLQLRDNTAHLNNIRDGQLRYLFEVFFKLGGVFKAVHARFCHP